MNKHLILSIFLSILTFSGCSEETVVINNGSNSKGQKCQDECSVENFEAECISDVKLKSCALNDDGCYSIQTVSCAKGKICQNNHCTTDQNNKDCTSECRNGSKSCTPDGKTMVCGDFNDDGCFENMISPCKTDEVCKNGICTKNTDEHDECIDECPQADTTQCSDDGNGLKICGNYDDDICLEWSDFSECPDNVKCSAGTCGCRNECDQNGLTQCDKSENGFRTCADINNDGCLEWSELSLCSNTQCQGGKCLCNHACKEDAKECSGDGFRTCTTDAQGCRVWSAITSCNAGCNNGECKPEVIMEPTRYPADRVLSPITAYSVKQMKAIAAKQSRKDLRFAKIGDSHFAPNSAFMYCFASNKTHNLNGADFLENVIQAFQSDGTNSFSRDSVSAVVGWRVNDAVSGKLNEELAAMNPRFAFIDYGSNDMGYYGFTRPENISNTGYFYTLEAYYKTYLKAIDQMISTGVIPIIIGTGIMDKCDAGLGDLNPRFFAPVFDALNRAMAEQYQIPYVNLMLLQNTEPLKSNHYGLNYEDWFKGYLHHSSKNGGCDFTDECMKYGHNARNRYAIEQLDRAWKTVVNDETAPDNAIPFQGTGKKSDPFIIPDVNFTHTGNSENGEKTFSVYSCKTDTHENGPENYYQLKLTSSKKIRAFAISSGDVNADIHLLSALDSNQCLARGDKWIEANLAAGTYYFVVDTRSGSGNYVFAITECMPDDGLCGSKTTGG